MEYQANIEQRKSVLRFMASMSIIAMFATTYIADSADTETHWLRVFPVIFFLFLSSVVGFFNSNIYDITRIDLGLPNSLLTFLYGVLSLCFGLLWYIQINEPVSDDSWAKGIFLFGLFCISLFLLSAILSKLIANYYPEENVRRNKSFNRSLHWDQSLEEVIKVISMNPKYNSKIWEAVETEVLKLVYENYTDVHDSMAKDIRTKFEVVIDKRIQAILSSLSEDYSWPTSAIEACRERLIESIRENFSSVFFDRKLRTIISNKAGFNYSDVFELIYFMDFESTNQMEGNLGYSDNTYSRIFDTEQNLIPYKPDELISLCLDIIYSVHELYLAFSDYSYSRDLKQSSLLRDIVSKSSFEVLVYLFEKRDEFQNLSLGTQIIESLLEGNSNSKMLKFNAERFGRMANFIKNYYNNYAVDDPGTTSIVEDMSGASNMLSDLKSDYGLI